MSEFETNDFNSEEKISEESTVEESVEETKKKPKKKSVGREIFEWFYSIAIAIVIALIIKGVFFDIVKVDGSSMYPTLVDGDRLVVTKLGYEPKQGDIVILDATYEKRQNYFERLATSYGKDELGWFDKARMSFSLPDDVKKIYYVKRVIATEGQTVDLIDGKVYVDGEMLDEPYYSGETYSIDATVNYPVTVEPGCVFVMGDNRGHSLDSRSSNLGTVPVEAILGHSQLRVFPFNSIGTTK